MPKKQKIALIICLVVFTIAVITLVIGVNHLVAMPSVLHTGENTEGNGR